MAVQARPCWLLGAAACWHVYVDACICICTLHEILRVMLRIILRVIMGVILNTILRMILRMILRITLCLICKRLCGYTEEFPWYPLYKRNATSGTNRHHHIVEMQKANAMFACFT